MRNETMCKKEAIKAINTYCTMKKLSIVMYTAVQVSNLVVPTTVKFTWIDRVHRTREMKHQSMIETDGLQTTGDR